MSTAFVSVALLAFALLRFAVLLWLQEKKFHGPL